MTASTLVTLSASARSGPVGLVNVPSVAPKCPIATIVLMPFFFNLAASALTAVNESATWKGSKAVGETNVGASSFVKPITPTFTPPKVVSKICDGCHSAGVLPLASTTFAERNGYCANGMSVLRKYADPRSKLWLPRPSAPKPMAFIISIVGVSPKNEEIGGVAPTESPAATVNEPLGASPR